MGLVGAPAVFIPLAGAAAGLVVAADVVAFPRTPAIIGPLAGFLVAGLLAAPGGILIGRAPAAVGPLEGPVAGLPVAEAAVAFTTAPAGMAPLAGALMAGFALAPGGRAGGRAPAAISPLAGDPPGPAAAAGTKPLAPALAMLPHVGHSVDPTIVRGGMVGSCPQNPWRLRHRTQIDPVRGHARDQAVPLPERSCDCRRDCA